MPKPLDQYERVPYRSTTYVEAEALDSATAQISALSSERDALLKSMEEKIVISEGQTVQFQQDLGIERSAHETTKELLASTQREASELRSWLWGTAPSPYLADVKEQADDIIKNISDKAVKAYQDAHVNSASPKESPPVSD